MPVERRRIIMTQRIRNDVPREGKDCAPIPFRGGMTHTVGLGRIEKKYVIGIRDDILTANMFDEDPSSWKHDFVVHRLLFLAWRARMLMAVDISDGDRVAPVKHVNVE